MRIEELEDKLYCYYKINERIRAYERIKDELIKEKEILEEKLENKQFHANIELKSRGFSEESSTKSNKYSSVENAVIKSESKIIYECKRLRLEIKKINSEINYMQYEYSIISLRLSCIDKKFEDTIRKAYKFKIKVPKVKRVRALEELNKWFPWWRRDFLNKEFKIIEDKLYKFFNKEITNKLKKQIDIITKQIEQVKKDLEEENIDSKVRYKYYEDLAVEREKLLELVDRIELDNGF